MPTGYTEKVKDGITFEQFIWTCARAFGTFVEMRDSSLDAPIPDRFEPSDYHTKELDKAHAEIAKVKGMSIEDAEAEAEEEYRKAVEYFNEAKESRKALEEKYRAMIASARAWQPPTSDHTELKNFMIQQLEESINFDCGTAYLSGPGKQQTGTEWREKRLNRLSEDVAYHAKKYAEEVERAEQRNKWIADLRASLKGASV